jgi:hypothetical protein
MRAFDPRAMMSGGLVTLPRHRGSPPRAETGPEDLVTFMNVSLSSPVAPAADTITGSLGVVGARFILDGGPSQGRFSRVGHPIIARGMAPE